MKAIITVLTLVSFSALMAAEKDTYENPTIGFSITKPADWHFMTAEQNAENLKRTQLKDEAFQKLVQKYANAPLVAITKYEEPYDDLNPSLKVNIRPLGNFKADQPMAILELITKQFESLFEDYKVITAPKEIKVAGLKAAYLKVHYSLKIPDGRSFPTCSELWIVPRGKHFFMIGAGTRQDEKTGKREELQQILKSVKIDKE
jgi:hypothetical protein